MITGSAVLNWVFDEAVPEISGIGQVGDANVTEISRLTLTPLNNVIQSFTWLTGVLYVMMLIACVGFVFAFRTSPNRWLMGFFVLTAVVLILGSMFISNMYEDFASGTDELAVRLKEHTILSELILNAPFYFTIITFITGIILFSGMAREQFT